MKRAIIIAAIAALLGCGGTGKPPKRGVLEHDVESWGFRRYQAVLDPEVWVKGNASAGHTASYVRKQAEKRGRLASGDVVNAFVTRFRRSKGLSDALIRFSRRLAQESGYVVEEERISGTRLVVIKGHGELWSWWPAKRHLVKIGGRGVESLPKKLIEAYADRYPSKLRDGALDAEVEELEEPEIETEEYDPENPTPEWDSEGKKKKKKRKKRKKKRRRE